ncbi:MAG: hypothetical protein ACK2T6_05455 [Anaerolineae bacterium]
MDEDRNSRIIMFVGGLVIFAALIAILVWAFTREPSAADPAASAIRAVGETGSGGIAGEIVGDILAGLGV